MLDYSIPIDFLPLVQSVLSNWTLPMGVLTPEASCFNVLYSFSPVHLAADMPSVVPSNDMVPPEQSYQSCEVHDNVQCITLGSHRKLWFVDVH